MTANELRIGNWYLMSGMGNNQFEQFINWTQALDFEAYGQPIVLTSDILEKCGFKKNKNGEPCIEINDIASHLELMVGVDNFHYPSFTQTPQGDEERTVYFNRINSLHQLQNLVHTLTGEELTVNL